MIRLRSLGALDDVKFNLIPFFQTLIAVALDGTIVYEDICPAVATCDVGRKTGAEWFSRVFFIMHSCKMHTESDVRCALEDSDKNDSNSCGGNLRIAEPNESLSSYIQKDPRAIFCRICVYSAGGSGHRA